jgi:hypothetical protein
MNKDWETGGANQEILSMKAQSQDGDFNIIPLTINTGTF